MYVPGVTLTLVDLALEDVTTTCDAIFPQRSGPLGNVEVTSGACDRRGTESPVTKPQVRVGAVAGCGTQTQVGACRCRFAGDANDGMCAF